MKFAVIIVILFLIGAYGLYKYNVVNIEQASLEVQEQLAVEQPAESTPEDDMSSTEALSAGPTVTPIEHASMVLAWGGTTIYVDPVGGPEKYTDQMAPDIVLMTDIHGDHLSIETLEGVIAGNTQIIAPQAVYDELSVQLQEKTIVLENDVTMEMESPDVTITAVPMYNWPEDPESRHTKGRGNGYLVERADFRLYIAGDTGPIPEMHALEEIDLAFVPMNMPYTMTVEEAAEAVIAFAPKTVIPYHYRGVDGLSDVARFKALVTAGNENITVLLLNWYPQTSVEEEGEEI